MAPSLSSSFKSVHARQGWGRALPVHLALGVPAAVWSSSILHPRITTLREDKIWNNNNNKIIFPFHNVTSKRKYAIKRVMQETQYDIFLLPRTQYKLEGQAV